MRYLLVVFSITFLFQSCDDGDIITVELDFDQQLELCTNNTQSYTLYDTRTDPNESLSLVFPRSGNNDIFVPANSPSEKTLNINTSSVLFNYRTYNQEPTFCNVIDDPDTIVQEDYQSTSGMAEFVTTFADNDNDGISAENEGFNATNPEMSTDTDMDGIPDYIDQDDDNDNIPTADEDDNEDGDDNPFTNPRDSDNDGIPDYLDDDDDNDGTLTRLEDENGNGNLQDDFVTPGDPNSTVRYLDETISQQFPGADLAPNTFTRITEITVTILNAGLEIINADVINLGTYTFSETDPE